MRSHDFRRASGTIRSSDSSPDVGFHFARWLTSVARQGPGEVSWGHAVALPYRAACTHLVRCVLRDRVRRKTYTIQSRSRLVCGDVCSCQCGWQMQWSLACSGVGVCRTCARRCLAAGRRRAASRLSAGRFPSAEPVGARPGAPTARGLLVGCAGDAERTLKNSHCEV